MARRRPVPQGLTIPRNVSAEMQRFCEQLLGLAEGLQGRITEIAGTTGGGGGGVGPGGTVPVTPGGGGEPIPILDTPPKPAGVDVQCGIGVCVVSFDNPWRYYANHGRALVFRNTVDQFDTAAEIGQTASFLLVDDDVEDETDYWYWVQYESTTQVLGPVSDSVMGRTALDPEAVYEEIVEWLADSRLLRDLQSPIEPPFFVLNEISRLSAVLNLILASASEANRTALTEARAALDEAIDANQILISGNTIEIQTLQASVSALGAALGQISGATAIFRPGPEPNRFTATTRAAAEALRDDTTRDGYTAWLAAYDAEQRNYITLHFD